MNFLSHYYFDRHSQDAERVLGGLLPDMLKAHRKTWIIRPEKHLVELQKRGVSSSLLIGWQRHKKIDKLFHASPFFTEETGYLKERLKPIFKDSPIWIFIMAHILLEICLDAMLLRNRHLTAASLYEKLKVVDGNALILFFELNGLEEGKSFMLYLNKFIDAGYLASYQEDKRIVYALDRICGKIWPGSFNAMQNERIEHLIEAYRGRLESRYLTIFNAIENLL